MMKRFLPIILLLGLLVCSCRTQQQIEPIRYQTMSQKGSVTLRLNQLEYTLFCTTQLWRNELVVLSLQPTLGLEMVRIEATNDSVTIVDKMNYRYTTLAYNWTARQVTPSPSFELIQNFVTAPIQEQQKKKFSVDDLFKLFSRTFPPGIRRGQRYFYSEFLRKLF